VELINLSNDVDLYLHQFKRPDFVTFDCRSLNKEAFPEVCIIDPLKNNQVNIGVYACKSATFKLKISLTRLAIRNKN